jgi:hydroxypyruvate isomerase
VPPAAEVDVFCDALAAAGVRLVALNLDTGDPGDGDRGLLSIPGLDKRVLDNLEVVMHILERTGCRVVNALWGNHEAPYAADDQYRTGFRRLVRVADRLAAIGACAVVETLNLRDNPAFPLTDIRLTADVVSRANAHSRLGDIGLLLDTYHLAVMGTDPVVAIRKYGPLIRHVQFADAPGRGRPGTGSVDFSAVEKALLHIGYTGYAGLEYDPHAISAGTHASIEKGTA